MLGRNGHPIAFICRRAAIVLAAMLPAGAAFAHAADRGFVMLLPTGYYLFGGAAAVAASFFMLVLARPSALERIAAERVEMFRAPLALRAATSWLSLAVLAFLLWAGLAGSRDPLSNPLPLVFWTLWWVGLTLLIGLMGDLWRWLDPWYGPWRLLARGDGETGLAGRLPSAVGRWPALVLLFVFGWFELVYPAPDDPDRLAVVLASYWLFNLAGALAFGHAAWMRRVECFSVFFSMIAKMAVFQRRQEEGHAAIDFRPPAAKALDAGALSPGGTLFLLLALSTVSFDGLSRTFFWLERIGVNPLEFPGRSAVLVSNTLGLAGAFAGLAGAFLLCVWSGHLAAGRRDGYWRAAGALVWSIVPIALAYHFSHYLTSLVLNGQYALAALSDPLSRGWNLFGTAGYHVIAGATAGYEAAWIVWNLQAAAIIGGHVLAVAVAHVAAFRIHGDRDRAALSQVPLAVLMVFYTVFGLWLLSSPTGY